MKALVANSAVITISKSEAEKLDKDWIEVSNTDYKYLNLITDKGATWTEQNIIAFRSRINRELGDYQLLMDMFDQKVAEYNGWNITDDQAQKGIEYLKKSLFTTKGLRRRSKLAEETNECLFEAVADFDHFTFVGLRDHGTGRYANNQPVYRIHTNCGLEVDYCYVSEGYQRGGFFEVIRSNYEPELRHHYDLEGIRDQLLDDATTEREAERIKDMDKVELVYNFNRVFKG